MMVFPVRVFTKICILALGPPARKVNTQVELQKALTAGAISASFRVNNADPGGELLPQVDS